MVLLGQGRQRDGRIRQAEAFSSGQPSADLNPGDGPFGMRLDHGEAQLAVVEQQAVAGLERRQHLGMRDMDALGRAGRRVGIEHEGGAAIEHHGVGREGPDAQLGALEIGQDADRPAEILLHAADHAHHLAHPLRRGVAHVDAEHVGAGLEQAGDRRLVGTGGSEGRDDLHTPLASHREGLPGKGCGLDGRPCAGGTAMKEGEPGAEGGAPAGRCEDCSLESVSCTVQVCCSPVSTSKKPVRS